MLRAPTPRWALHPASAGREPSSTTAWTSALVCLGVAVVLLVLQPYRIDLDVYRIGAKAWLDGLPLYGQLPATQAGLSLPFTYPPAAAILFAPLAVLPFWAANAVATVSSVTALIVLLVLAVGRSKAGRASGGAALALLAASLLAEPVQATLGFGQVNLVLAAMVALDVLTPRTWWPRGLLIGIASAVKLTPAVFVLALLVRRQYREAATAALSFAIVSLLAWVVAPRDSEQYWTGALWDPDRIGGAAYAGNQSINGLLLRLGLTGQAERAGLVDRCCTRRRSGMGRYEGGSPGRRHGAPARHQRARRAVGLPGVLDPPLGLAAATWARPVDTHRPGWLARVLAAFGASLMLLRPMWWLPREADRELDWAPWQQVPGNAYVLFGVAVLLAAALGPPARNKLHRGLVARLRMT